MNNDRFLIIMLMIFACLLSACATDECTDGKCIEAYDPEWGTSRLISLEPNSGEGRWMVDFHGEALEIRRLQDNGNSVVVAALDPCFDKPKLTAIALSKEGGLVDVLPPTVETPPLDWCADVTMAGVTAFDEISGICVGLEDATRDVVAVDPSDNSELWRSALNASSVHVFNTVLIVTTEVAVADTVQYRVLRLSAANGSTLWMHPSREIITPLGANGQLAFFLDNRPFAINLSTGDLAWQHLEDNWGFVPGQDGGQLLGDTLLVKRQYFINSECVTPATQ